MDSTDHHRQGPQAAAAHFAGGSHRYVDRDGTQGGDLLLRWKGGAISELAVPIRRQPPKIRTDEDTIGHPPGGPSTTPTPRSPASSTGQHRRTAKGLSYTPARVQTLRFRNDIPGRLAQPRPPRKENCSQWQKQPGTGPGPLHRAPLAERRIHMRRATHPRRAVADPAHRRYPRPARRQHPTAGCSSSTLEATHAYGLLRQTLLQRVKRGEIRAVYLRTGRKKGLRITSSQAGLF